MKYYNNDEFDEIFNIDFRYFLINSEINEKTIDFIISLNTEINNNDVFGWKFFSYIVWKKKKLKINYYKNFCF